MNVLDFTDWTSHSFSSGKFTKRAMMCLNSGVLCSGNKKAPIPVFFCLVLIEQAVDVAQKETFAVRVRTTRIVDFLIRYVVEANFAPQAIMGRAVVQMIKFANNEEF